MNAPDKVIIECPHCSNQYEVGVAAISEEGTNLKCTACGHEWAVKKVVEPASQDNQETKPKLSEPITPSQNESPKEGNREKRSEKKPVSPSGCLVFFALIPVLSFLFGAFVVASRDEIIRVVPPISSVYEAWGIQTPQLHLSVVSSEATLDTTEEGPILKITGEIANTGVEQVNALPIRVVLRDESNQKIAEKFATLSPTDLSAGASWQYKIEFRDPPSNWHTHEVAIVGVSRVR